MPIDLRSDTLTQPTGAMREAMAQAPVGDDVFGEDPTARRLEELAAELLGKQAALFVPSGSMANLIALLLHCRPGDEVIIGRRAHVFIHEAGAGAAWAGVQFAEVGEDGTFTAEQAAAAIKPEDYYLPRTSLVALENTHNRGGGRVFPQEHVVAIAELAHERGLPVHLDGARIWNAAAATGLTERQLADPADTISACFSKGLGAPVGSVLAGRSDAIARARRLRKMLGGGMRQVGVLCAGALYALEHHREGLTDDHEHARILAEALDASPGVVCDLDSVQTNIVNFHSRKRTAEEVVARAAERGVLVAATDVRAVRAVTHMHITHTDAEAAGRALAEAAV